MTKFDIILDSHRRIKIFNEKAKDKGNIRIEYYSLRGYEKLIFQRILRLNLYQLLILFNLLMEVSMPVIRWARQRTGLRVLVFLS
ncbi:hypothetical protein ADIARSV_0392 [Arcticibacter svalbardensis MN12-7]|uniref:Uncharacterized protein n=1 Tax=Arcticibacter svalbardensis MN12-7 TaxID=1150600 RepID=R9H5N7_9SPHI|nr:hypothetical protein ADIARSV_0392 [Arcticibacter svalbardensis MN12-7]